MCLDFCPAYIKYKRDHYAPFSRGFRGFYCTLREKSYKPKLTHPVNSNLEIFNIIIVSVQAVKLKFTRSQC